MLQNINQIISEANSINNDNDIKKFWQLNISKLRNLIIYIDISESEKILDYIQSLRGQYFMTANHNIDTIYQELCQLAISIKIKNKDKWVENYLRYFDPEWSYYLRIKGLMCFRLLSNPKQQIEWVYSQTINYLYRSILWDSDNLNKARDILKEYFDKLFAIKDISDSDKKKWFENNQEGTIESKFWYNDKELHIRLDNQTSDINSNNQEISKIEDIKSNVYNTTELLDIIKNKDNIIQELQNQIIKFNTSTIKSDEIVINDDNILLDRSLYRIDVIWWSDKTNKKYKQIQKEFDIVKYGLSWQQLWDPICDYNWQKKLKSSQIKDSLIMWKTNFILAIQTDHETEFANLCKNPEFTNHITVFCEDEKYNWQSLSNDRFDHYLNLALEKYERYIKNTMSK